MPSPIAVPKETRAPGPDGMPLIVTPRDMDPLGEKQIVTPKDIEELKERAEGPKPEPKIIPGR